VDILDHSTFEVYKAPQGFGGVCQGGGSFREGHIGRRGPVFFYNFDEKRNMSRDYPLPRIP